MRKAKRLITDPAIVKDMLDRCHVGRLGTVGRDGWPMVKPVNFVHVDGRIYFHSAAEGEKIDHITGDDRICFETDLPVAYVRAATQPCEATYLYRSVIIKGRAAVLHDISEKILALQRLMEKYQPGFGSRPIPDDTLAITAVIRITIDEITGKEHFKNNELRESALAALDNNTPLPLCLDRKIEPE